MRITGGAARGISLKVPTKGGVRPATDYIREAIFNSLAALIPGARVLDLFTGTGAYALESMSRGALSATCVDLHIGSEIISNTAAVAKSLGRESLAVKTLTADATRPLLIFEKFDLIFADPPWELWETQADEIIHQAIQLAAEDKSARVIFEAPGGFVIPIPTGWKLKKVIGKGKGQPAASVLIRNKE